MTILITAPTTGIYDNISNEDYHRMEGLSNSGVSLILDCPYRYWYEKLSGQYVKHDTESLIVGAAIDCRIFERELFDEKYTVMPDDIKIRSGKNWEAFAIRESRIILTRKEWSKVINTANAVDKNPIFAEIKSSGRFQQTIIWRNEDGVILRSRPDWINDDFIIDLKSTKSAKPEDFSRSVGEYGYHTQAFMQREGSKVVTEKERIHILFAVEKDEPHISELYCIDEQSLEVGKANCERGAFIYKQCLENNDWPSYNSGAIQNISIKPWLLSQGKS